MKWSALILTCTLSTAILRPAWSSEPVCHGLKVVTVEEDAAATALERLKKLVGDWEMVNPADATMKGKVASRYRLIGNGTTVAETIFPDTALEMLSVYHRDGDQLVMTHYCAAGNQPRMRARIGKHRDELVFEYTGGANINPEKDLHIHGGRVRFVDADHIHSEWDIYTNGKPTGQHAFDLVRKKN